MADIKFDTLFLIVYLNLSFNMQIRHVQIKFFVLPIQVPIQHLYFLSAWAILQEYLSY